MRCLVTTKGEPEMERQVPSFTQIQVLEAASLGHTRSHSTAKVTQHIQGHTAHPRSHNVSKVTQHTQGHMDIQGHTVYSRSHNTAKVTQYIQAHVVHPRSDSIARVTEHS